MPNENYQHIYLRDTAKVQGFTSPHQRGPEPRIPSGRDRIQHSAFLQERLREAWVNADHQRSVVHVERNGAYIEFEGEPGFDLAIQSLENIKSGIRLLNVRVEGDGESQRTIATVFVPFNQRGYFLRKIQAYSNPPALGNSKPKNAKLVDSISNIRNAVLESFWRPDERKLIPQEEIIWLEIWLRSDENAVVTRFDSLLEIMRIQSAMGTLKFPERSVKLIRANRDLLNKLIESSDDIAECRAAKEIASFYIELENADQIQHVQALLNRTTYTNESDIAVCILDTGANNGHLLIQPILETSDLHSVNQEWGTSDHNGHGTLMAGTAAYGDLLALLNGGQAVQIGHRIESAKILPPPALRNPRELWGFMTAQGISRAEIQAPLRKRIICMAVTSREIRERGRPSSWSAAIDEIASGYEDNIRRLLILSAGNVDDSNHWLNYPIDNLTNEIHDPGQAWNALTIGSFTEKVRITDPTMASYFPVAPAGGLSPYSTTSTTWSARKWPVKPEVVFEGGNVACGPNNSILDHDDLQLLSTYHDPQIAQFAAFKMTSASTALAAWMAAQIQIRYPQTLPETIRALIVHSAKWTEQMKSQFLPEAPTKKDYARLLRICGYGVPKLEDALYCASNSLTLISEAELQPFDKREGRYVTRDMHLYSLPWPSDILSELGETHVKMRITLSYFVEPGPGEVGWENRYRYASHALRFAINGPSESEQEFVRRVNNQARTDGEHPGTEGPWDKWVIGDARNVGSIHSDIWQGQAVELAASNKIAIYPAVGWWRERHNLGRWNKKCRYSLIVSIHTPAESPNIYIPIAQTIGLTIPITIPSKRQS